MVTKVEELQFTSTGLCPDCEECRNDFAPELSMKDFNKKIQDGEICDEGSFSSWHCDECHNTLGGQRFIAHSVGEESKELYHFTVCYGCLMEINGYKWSEEFQCWE